MENVVGAAIARGGRLARLRAPLRRLPYRDCLIGAKASRFHQGRTPGKGTIEVVAVSDDPSCSIHWAYRAALPEVVVAVSPTHYGDPEVALHEPGPPR
jgi:hypothetical protein